MFKFLFYPLYVKISIFCLIKYNNINSLSVTYILDIFASCFCPPTPHISIPLLYNFMCISFPLSPIEPSLCCEYTAENEDSHWNVAKLQVAKPLKEIDSPSCHAINCL